VDVANLDTGHVKIVNGRTTDGDTGAGFFKWVASSTETDNDETVIRPDSVLAGEPGRWKKLYAATDTGISGEIAALTAALSAKVSTTDPRLQYITPPAGEVGVLFPTYPVGDVRRYGVFPDGVTNWESDHLTKMNAIYANSCLPGITVYWPGGTYNTSI